MFPLWYLLLLWWQRATHRDQTPSIVDQLLLVDNLVLPWWNPQRWFGKPTRLPRYETDEARTCYVIGKRGVVPTALHDVVQVLVPTFDIAANPTLMLSELTYKRFTSRLGLMARAIRRGEESLNRQREMEVFKVITSAVQREHWVEAVRDDFEPKDLLTAMGKIVEHECPVKNIVAHPSTIALMKAWTTPRITWTVSKKDARRGVLGYFDNAAIFMSTMTPKNVVYVLAAPNYVGVMPVRGGRRVARCNDHKRLRIGWVMWEERGYAVINSHLIARVMLFESKEALEEWHNPKPQPQSNPLPERREYAFGALIPPQWRERTPEEIQAQLYAPENDDFGTAAMNCDDAE